MKFTYRPKKTHAKYHLMALSFVILLSTLAIRPNLKQTADTTSDNPVVSSAGVSSSDTTNSSAPASSASSATDPIDTRTNSTPPQATPVKNTPTSVSSPPATTPSPASECAQFTGAIPANVAQQLANAQGKLSLDETNEQTGEVLPGMYEDTPAQVQAYWSNQVAQDQEAVNTAAVQVNIYKEPSPC